MGRSAPAAYPPPQRYAVASSSAQDPGCRATQRDVVASNGYSEEYRPGCGGFGSGMFVSRHGDILTSAHVVTGCSNIAVRASSGRVYAARLQARDPAHDLAALRVDGEVPGIAVFDPRDPRPSARVAAVGFPEDRLPAPSATAALAPASGSLGEILLPDAYTTNPNLIALSATLARGSSGGPIIDQTGHVVGVVYAQYNRAPHVYFAVASHAALRFMDTQSIAYSVAVGGAQQSLDHIIADAMVYTVFVQCLA